MEFKIHEQGTNKVAELITDECIIKTAGDGKDAMANAYQQGADSLIVASHQLDERFFDLSTRLAGNILQTFSNYQMKLAVIGDFSNVGSKSLKDFIYESNKGNLVYFTDDITKAIKKLSR